MPRNLLTTLLMMTASCGFEPVDAAEFEPPPAYQAWWASTEACSGRRSDFHAVRWFVVPGSAFECPNGRCVGRWQPGSRIYLAEGFREHELVVRHEMLHAILDRAGHPDPPFGRGCPLTWSAWLDAGGPAGPVVID